MLLNLINDLLDLAKQEKFTFQLNKDFFNLTEAVTDTFNTLSFLSNKKGITLKLDVSKKDTRFFTNLFGDKARIEQLLLNFVSNALKFTGQNGKVTVGLKVSQAIRLSHPEDKTLPEVQQSLYSGSNASASSNGSHIL